MKRVALPEPLRVGRLLCRGLPGRRGITLIEVLITVSIIAILLALLVPAVLASRMRARSTQCQSHLRQIGVGLQAFDEVHGELPQRYFHYALLPHLGFRPLIDLKKQADSEPEDPDQPFRAWAVLNTHVPPLYQCPGDDAPRLIPDHELEGSPEIGGTNYMCNYGSDWTGGFTDGMFTIHRAIRLSEVTDGLAQTAMVSEALRLSEARSRLRVAWLIKPGMFELSQMEAFANRCERIPAWPESQGYVGFDRGSPWYGGPFPEGVNYTHLVPPNRPACLNEGQWRLSCLPPASLHRGGAHVLFADGHVDLISETIDRGVFREMGSRH